MAASVRDTSEGRVDVCLIVDADDPELGGYYHLVDEYDLLVLPERVGYTASLNAAAARFWDDHSILGAFGDDVIFRTDNWDRQIEAALTMPGIAYGNDMIHGAKHPTAVFMSSSIAKALGWLALPAVRHQWADDAWKRLGLDSGLLRFVDIIVEHMHPAVGKSEMDPTYEAIFGANEEAAAQAKADYEAFNRWVATGLRNDLRAVRGVR